MEFAFVLALEVTQLSQTLAEHILINSGALCALGQQMQQGVCSFCVKASDILCSCSGQLFIIIKNV